MCFWARMILGARCKSLYSLRLPSYHAQGVVLPEPQIRKVWPRTESATWHPAYMDSHQEWKDFCNSFRVSAKQIIRSATMLAPLQAVAFASESLTRVMATWEDAASTAPKRHSAMTTFVLTLESVVPTVCDLMVSQQQVSEGDWRKCCHQVRSAHANSAVRFTAG